MGAITLKALGCGQNMKTITLLLIFSCFSRAAASALATATFPAEMSIEQIQQAYLQTQSFFSQRLCIPGTEEKFWQLFRSYKAEGLYVPTFQDQEIDLTSIRANLGHLKEKLKWLAGVKVKLQQKVDFRRELGIAEGILQVVEEILVINYRQVLAPSELNRQEVQNKLDTLKKLHLNLIGEIYYLLPFKYPQDYLQLRWRYDQLKQQVVDKYHRDLEHQANDLFFFRQMVEDGANEENGTGPDLYLRTTLSTIGLLMEKPLEQLTENLRYDLVDVIDKMQKLWKKGIKYSQTRHENWINKTQKQLVFFQGLLQAKKEAQRQFLKKRASSLHQLRDFVASHLGHTYQFWADYPLWYQYLFAMETIFTNEVGRLDGPGGVERLDIAQVVLNRSNFPEFWQMDAEKVTFFQYVPLAHRAQWQKYLWSNLLMKPGEFSFTYFYLPSVIRIFCPEMTTAGKRRRAENVQLAIWAAKNPQASFQALRYFSRASMTGRIDMSVIWSDYVSFPERPGMAVEGETQKKLVSQFQGGNFKYLYSINQTLQVLQFADDEYVYDSTAKFFYYHRNPHYFTYFKKEPAR